MSDDTAVVAPADQHVLGIIDDDVDATFRSEHVLDEECDFTDLRTPGGLVPADRTVIEHDLELTVIVHVGRNFVGQPGADRMHADRLRPGHVAHHVDIMHAAIDDRR